MNTNDLCTIEESRKGFSAHYSDFGIVVLKNGKWYCEVENETELHNIIKEA